MDEGSRWRYSCSSHLAILELEKAPIAASTSGGIPLLKVGELCGQRPLERGSALAACLVGRKVGVLGHEGGVVEDA